MKNRLGALLVVALAGACGRATAGSPPSSPTPASAPSPTSAAATSSTAPADTGAARPGEAPASTARSGESNPAVTAGGSLPTPAEFEALYRARADSARLRVSPADVHFMEGMIHHHAQAIVMARMAPSHGASASIRTLCARIINAQTDEIHTMQQWLRDRHQPVPEVDSTGAMVMAHDSGMAMHHDMPGMHMGQPTGAPGSTSATGSMEMMPGMLTPAQLQQLARAHGEEFDRLFLTDMIQHHRGAITMVNELFSTDGAGQDQTVFKLASDVQVDQTTEVARMQRMLAQLGLSGQGL
jgi:uncharacterized protein (DUF305 family)